jgi:pilus assembly protein CpaE
MSTTEFNGTRTRPSARVAEFVAFVSDRDTEQVLKRFVLEEAMPHTHIVVGGIDDAIAHLAKVERSPQFLLIDLHGSAMPLSDLGKLSEVCEPSVQVVALGERNDVGLFRSLLKIGVRDYLVKPLTVELLKRTINLSQGAVAPVSHARVGKTIAFAGVRDGVGVTSIAMHLARYLTNETHRRVAYVDLDLTGGAACSMLGLRSNDGLTEVLQNVHRLDPQYLERTMIANDSRLHVLSAEQGFAAEQHSHAGAFSRVAALLCDSFHYVFLDVHLPSGPLANEAFSLAKRVYLVSDRSVFGAHRAVRLLRHIENRDSNPQTSVIVNSPNAVTHGKVHPSDFTSAVGRKPLHEFEFEPRALQIAENLGEPAHGKAASGFAQSITRIADDLTGQVTKPAESLLQRVSRWRK